MTLPAPEPEFFELAADVDVKIECGWSSPKSWQASRSSV
jgi:hypothetical protein